MVARVNTKKCKGCGSCMLACLEDAITLVDKKACIGESCTLCRECYDACPMDAIVFEEEVEA
jgi:NAD-dependent dihydropyrimidine dehydrogenase PreA subunit